MGQIGRFLLFVNNYINKNQYNMDIIEQNRRTERQSKNDKSRIQFWIIYEKNNIRINKNMIIYISI